MRTNKIYIIVTTLLTSIGSTSMSAPSALDIEYLRSSSIAEDGKLFTQNWPNCTYLRDKVSNRETRGLFITDSRQRHQEPQLTLVAWRGSSATTPAAEYHLDERELPGGVTGWHLTAIFNSPLDEDGELIFEAKVKDGLKEWNGAIGKKPTLRGRHHGAPLDLETLPISFPYIPSDYGFFVPIGAFDESQKANLFLDSFGVQVPFLQADGRLWAPQLGGEGNLTLSIFAAIKGTPQNGAITTRDAFPSLSASETPRGISRSKLYPLNAIYERAVPLPVGERFVAYRLSKGSGIDTNLSVSDQLTSTTMTAEVSVWGLNTLDNGLPDHYAEFALNGVFDSTTFEWMGRTGIDATITVDLPSIPATGNDIVFRHLIPNSPTRTSDLQNLDTVELAWEGIPYLDQLGQSHLIFNEASPSTISVGGFPAAPDPDLLVVIDSTNPANMVRLTNLHTYSDGSGGSFVEFEVPAGPSEFRVAYLDTAKTSAPNEAAPTMPTPPAGELKGIYVAESSLHAALQPLLDHRGAGFVLLDPQAAYNRYNHSKVSADAIKDAVREIIADAPSVAPLPSITLVGHSTFDTEDQLGLINGAAQIPTFIDESVDTGFTIENSTDFAYGLLYGEDDIQDAAVGRLPVKNGTELAIVVDRIIAAELAVDALREIPRTALFIMDDELSFILDVDDYVNYWAPTTAGEEVVILDESSTGLPEREQIIASLEDEAGGPALVLYTGHGNNTFWSDERMIRDVEVMALNNQEYYPLVATFTCLNGYYAFPGSTVLSLGEQWMLQDNRRGAIAAIIPASVDFYSNQRLFAFEFLNALTETHLPQTIGEVLTNARIRYAIKYPTFDLTNREYLLFGDPNSPLMIYFPPDAKMADWSDFAK